MLLLVSRLELVDSERAIVKLFSRSLSPKKLFCCFVIINNKNIDINKYLFQHILHSDISKIFAETLQQSDSSVKRLENIHVQPGPKMPGVSAGRDASRPRRARGYVVLIVFIICPFSAMARGGVSASLPSVRCPPSALRARKSPNQREGAHARAPLAIQGNTRVVSCQCSFHHSSPRVGHALRVWPSRTPPPLRRHPGS